MKTYKETTKGRIICIKPNNVNYSWTFAFPKAQSLSKKSKNLAAKIFKIILSLGGSVAQWFGLGHLSLKVQCLIFFYIKFSTLCNLRWRIHQNLTSKTHLHAIIRGFIVMFYVRFLMYNLRGGTVMLNLMFCIFDITVYGQWLAHLLPDPAAPGCVPSIPKSQNVWKFFGQVF